MLDFSCSKYPKMRGALLRYERAQQAYLLTSTREVVYLGSIHIHGWPFHYVITP